MADQVRQEHDRAIEERDDGQIASSEIAFDLLRQLSDALGDLAFADQDALHLGAPAGRNAGGGHSRNDGRWLSHKSLIVQRLLGLPREKRPAQCPASRVPDFWPLNLSRLAV